MSTALFTIIIVALGAFTACAQESSLMPASSTSSSSSAPMTPAPDYGCGYACTRLTDSNVSSLTLTHKLLIAAAAIVVVSCIGAVIMTLCCVRCCWFCRKAAPATDPTNDSIATTSDPQHPLRVDVTPVDVDDYDGPGHTPFAAPAATIVQVGNETSGHSATEAASVSDAAVRAKEAAMQEAGRNQYCTALQPVTIGRVVESQEIHAAVIVATEPVVPS